MKVFLSIKGVVLGSLFAWVALAAMERSARAQAATDFTTTPDGAGGLVITGYTGTVTDVVIPASINSLSVTSIAAGAFSAQASLTTVTIPNTITGIGAGAFSGCSLLHLAIFNGNAPTMGSGVFTGTDLQAVDYFNNASGFAAPTWTDSSNDQYPAAQFMIFLTNNNTQVAIESGYTGPNAVVIPATAQGLPVTSLDTQAFAFSGITAVAIPSSVTTVGDQAFYDCAGLTAIDIPNSVTSIGASAFEICTNLTSLTLPVGLTSISDYTFFGDTGLTHITIPSTVTSIGTNSFFNCSNLSTITIPTAVTSIADHAFDTCTGLSSITIPGHVASIGSHAFANTGISGINIPASVTSIGSAPFALCASLSAITVDANNPDFTATVDGVLLSKDQTLLIDYPEGSTATTYSIPALVTTIGPEAFESASTLTAVTIPSGVTTIETQAFYECSGLISVTIPATVTAIGAQAFLFCTSLTSATFNGNAPMLGGNVFVGVANGFTVKYHDGAIGFPATSGTWAPDANDSYPAIDLGGVTFSVWLGFHTGVTDTTTTGTPQHDGIPNLLKYLFDIDPTRPMTGADIAGLPVLGKTTSGSSSFLTLTFGDYSALTGVTINVQTSSDLVHWTTLTSTTGTPDATHYAETDTGTNDPNGDPYVQVKALITGTKQQFLRLNVTGP